jgi:hypothetical protein
MSCLCEHTPIIVQVDAIFNICQPVLSGNTASADDRQRILHGFNIIRVADLTFSSYNANCKGFENLEIFTEVLSSFACASIGWQTLGSNWPLRSCNRAARKLCHLQYIAFGQ